MGDVKFVHEDWVGSLIEENLQVWGCSDLRMRIIDGNVAALAQLGIPGLGGNTVWYFREEYSADKPR